MSELDRYRWNVIGLRRKGVNSIITTEGHTLYIKCVLSWLTSESVWYLSIVMKSFFVAYLGHISSPEPITILTPLQH